MRPAQPQGGLQPHAPRASVRRANVDAFGDLTNWSSRDGAGGRPACEIRPTLVAFLQTSSLMHNWQIDIAID